MLCAHLVNKLKNNKMKTEITNENYFSNFDIWSNSLYKVFAGTPTIKGCESKGLAMIRGEYKQEVNTAMLVGSYVDSYFSGEIEKFKKENPSIFTQKGELRAEFKKAEEIINTIKEDEYFLRVISGEQQVILQGEINGVPFKGKIDSLLKSAIVDLKVVASIRDLIWSDKLKTKITFIEAYGYVEQLAIYRELYRQMTSNTLHCFIAAVSKETVSDKEFIKIPDEMMDDALTEVGINILHFDKVKKGEIEPTSCGVCDYCKSKKKIKGYINLENLY